VAPVEEVADMDEGDHNQDMDTGVGDDKDQDVEAGAAGSYRLEDQGDSDRLGEQDPCEKISYAVQFCSKKKAKLTGY